MCVTKDVKFHFGSTDLLVHSLSDGDVIVFIGNSRHALIGDEPVHVIRSKSGRVKSVELTFPWEDAASKSTE